MKGFDYVISVLFSDDIFLERELYGGIIVMEMLFCVYNY